MAGRSDWTAKSKGGSKTLAARTGRTKTFMRARRSLRILMTSRISIWPKKEMRDFRGRRCHPAERCKGRAWPWTIEFLPDALKDLKALDRTVAARHRQNARTAYCDTR